MKMSCDMLLFLSAASTHLTFVSCTKENAVPISTTWAFNGMTFKTAITVNDSGGSALSLLSAVDSLGNGIAIEFNSHPRVNGTYMPTYYYFSARASPLTIVCCQFLRCLYRLTFLIFVFR